MIQPICQKCIYLSDVYPEVRPCVKIPIFHKNMFCSNPDNEVKDHVTGINFSPYCEEVNRHGECLVYYPKGLECPELTFNDMDNIVHIKGTFPFVVDFNNNQLNANLDKKGKFDEETETYSEDIKIEHTCYVKASCVEDGVLSAESKIKCEIPDIPVIEFDKETNTVSIISYNTVFYSTDGSNVTEDSEVYKGPFVIDHNTVIKCRSYARNDFSKQIERTCISIEAPIIEFNDSNEVSLIADDKILYSTDGSDVYTDSLEYDGPFIIEKNTLIKAACIVDGELSNQVEAECKVPDVPVITYDKNTHKVTIEAENEIRYSLDGEDVKKKNVVYTSPFTISETCTVKAVSFVGERTSEQAELLCLFVSPPEILFDEETKTVSITGDDKILYSTDGSKIYDDAEEYTAPFVIDKNTIVKACCIKDGMLSEEVSLICKVPSTPSISFDQRTKTVSIKGENTILFTTDGSDVKKKDSEYKSPFKITATSTIKAKAIVNDRFSEQAELECVID